jgi:L-ascorbate metabolism protein UlaG (beta-lactamase superfamily)
MGMVTLGRAQKVGRKFLNPVPTTVGGPKLMLSLIPLYLSNQAETEPKTALGPFRTDASVYAREPAGGLRVTWFGHSSMLVEVDGVRVLVDPVWDLRAAPVQWFGPKRFFAPTLKLEELPAIDAVLLSHDHYDHLGEGTVRELVKLRPELRWVTSLGVGKELRGFGVRAERITELDWTESAVVTGRGGAEVRITSVAARHFSGRSLLNRFETLWASFVLAGRAHRVYYGADSGYWEGFEAIGAEYGPFDLTMLEIGAFNELWKDIHLGPDGAARAFEAVSGTGGGGLLMPIHWGLFNLALHGWREPIERMTALADAKGLKLFSPRPGEPVEVVAGGEVRSGWWRRGELGA